jgi:hypothetical protein
MSLSESSASRPIAVSKRTELHPFMRTNSGFNNVMDFGLGASAMMSRSPAKSVNARVCKQTNRDDHSLLAGMADRLAVSSRRSPIAGFGGLRRKQSPYVYRFCEQAVDLAQQWPEMVHFHVRVEVRLALPVFIEHEDTGIPGIDVEAVVDAAGFGPGWVRPDRLEGEIAPPRFRPGSQRCNE